MNIFDMAKLTPFVSKEWVLKQMGCSMEGIIACSEEHKKAFVERISQPGENITESDLEVIKLIVEGEPDRRAGPLC